MFKWRRDSLSSHLAGKVSDGQHVPEADFPVPKSNTNASDDTSCPRHPGWSRLPPPACAIEDWNLRHQLGTLAHCRGRQKIQQIGDSAGISDKPPFSPTHNLIKAFVGCIPPPGCTSVRTGLGSQHMAIHRSSVMTVNG